MRSFVRFKVREKDIVGIIASQAQLHNLRQVAVPVRAIAEASAKIAVLVDVVYGISGLVVDEVEIVVAELLDNPPEGPVVLGVDLGVVAAVLGARKLTAALRRIR